MTFLERNNASLVKTINILFCLFPLSIIVGNFSINLNLFLFCICGILYLKFKIISIKFDFASKIIFSFFLILFVSTLFNFLVNNKYVIDGSSLTDNVVLFKSIFFLRFFLLFLIIYYLSSHNILNLKYFLISITFLTTVISLDIIFQYILGFNIIGLKNIDPRHYSGFFGSELVAGGYLQNFSFFSIFFINFLFKKQKILKNVLTISAIVILGLGIFFSGNKMSLLMFLFGLLLSVFFNKELIKNIILGLIILLISFKAIFIIDLQIKYHYSSIYKMNTQYTPFKQQSVDLSFVNSLKNILTVKSNKNILETDSRTKLLLTAIDTWKFNKVFGNGLKSFRNTCHKLIPPEFNLDQTNKVNVKNRLCSTHPHNYYFEILSETGILGVSIVIIIALSFLFFIIKNFNLTKSDKLDNLIFASATLHLFLVSFPFRSTGSIFTTSSAIYLILFAALMLSSKQSISSARSIIK